jgi:hypothetical protein
MIVGKKVKVVIKKSGKKGWGIYLSCIFIARTKNELLYVENNSDSKPKRGRGEDDNCREFSREFGRVRTESFVSRC